MTKKRKGTIDFLAGDEIGRIIKSALRRAGRLPKSRSLIVESVSLDVDNGTELSAWGPGYPAEFYRARNESVVWIIRLREFLSSS